MQEQHEDSQPKSNRPRSRQITADFTRVEDLGTMPAMGPLELEARKKIAERSQTPVDELMSFEEAKSRFMAKCAAMRLLKGLIRRKGFLPRRQRLVYELCYVSKLPDDEAAYLMDISQVSIRRLRMELSRSFVRVLKKKEQDEAFLRKVKFLRLTRRQTRVVRLRFCEGFSTSQIAKLTRRSKRSVNEVVRRVREKIFQA
ncbi:MAG: hypothetical protein V1882_02010 [Candidatus Omnitrophota bacterium]